LAPTAKPGGFVLGLVLCLAFTGWLWNLLAAQKLRPILLGLATMVGLSVLYVAAYLGIDTVVSPSVPAVVVGSWITTPMLLIATAFASLFALQSLLTVGSKGAWREALYVHASNGFYIDVIVRRAFGSLASS
jgi:NAD(P)H-quinone oxidoreductase subunit 5